MSESHDEPIIYIQRVPVTGAVSPESAGEEFIKASARNLSDVADVVRIGWANMVAKIAAMPSPPSEIGVEFGIDVSAEGGVPFITKGGIGANFKVSIIWKKADG